MTTQRVTIELPEPVFRQLVRIAQATCQPIEALVTQSVLSNLPPSVENAPSELQPELLNLQSLDDEQLLGVAQAQVDPTQHERHTELLEKNSEGELTQAEQQELVTLRQAADRLMLRKAYAWSLLKWRGRRVPSLKELPILL